MNFYEYIISVAGEKKIHTADGEMIDGADDYKSLFENLFGLTDGEMKLESFQYGSDDGETADISLTINGRKHSVTLETDGWIDEDFIKKLNSLVEPDAARRFYEFWAMDSFGQETGFFYADEKTGSRILEYALKYNEDKGSYSELYMVSNSRVTVGYNDEF